MSEEIIKSESAFSNVLHNRETLVSMREPDSIASKVAIYNATVSSLSLRDHVGESIDVNGILVKPDTVEVDGETKDSFMAVIIDMDGNGYMTHSTGVVNAIGNIISTFGTPDRWPDGMRVVPVEETSRRGFKFLTLRIVF